jgi:uncharacterized protein YjaZ
MEPYKDMWKIMQIPIKCKFDGEYDIIMACDMLGIWTPNINNHDIESEIDLLESSCLNNRAIEALKLCTLKFNSIGHKIPLDCIQFSILLANRDSNEVKISNGYSGFGGIPGYIYIQITPNDYTLPRLEHAIAHEFNHQVRFCYEPFNHGNVSVGDYLVMEGLAESFAVEVYGKEMIGPWVSNFNKDDLEYSREIIKDALDVKGFSEVRSYMFGDDMADTFGYQRVGLSANAGYAVGYELVQSYLRETNSDIMTATVTDSKEIIEKSKYFL